MTETRGVDLEPIIKSKNLGIATYTVPLCRSYSRGKYRRSSLQSKKISPNSEHPGVIKDGNLIPGDCISTDQYECSIKRRLPNTRRREDPQNIFRGGTLSIDFKYHLEP